MPKIRKRRKPNLLIYQAQNRSMILKTGKRFWLSKAGYASKTYLAKSDTQGFVEGITTKIWPLERKQAMNYAP